MIKSVRLTNFFSFRDCEITLEPDVTVLVGINGSGKTNLLRAFELVKAGFSGEAVELLGYWGGAGGVSHKGREPLPLEKGLSACMFFLDADTINWTSPEKKAESVIYTVLIGEKSPTISMLGDGLGGVREGETIIWLKGGQKSWASSVGVNANLMPGDDAYPKGAQVFHLGAMTKKFALQMMQDHEVFPTQASAAQTFNDLALYSDFDTRPRSQMRQSIQATGLDVLDADGANLFQILNTIQLKSTEAGDAIEKDLKEVNPNFDRLQFQPLGQGGMLTYLREIGLKTPIPAAHVSDGTLRYLCLLAIAHNPDRGRLICLDEPERGLHPDMLAGVARLLLDDGHAKPDAPRHTSYVVATHSPQLLNRFPLRCLRIFEKDENNQTVVRQFGDDEIARFREWYETYDAGSLWLKGELGGTRW